MKEVEQLYRQIGKTFKAFDTWSFYIITSHPEFEKIFGRRADKKRKLYNGRLLCNYYQFFGPPPPKHHNGEPEIVEHAGTQSEV
jgi:putative N6-adenine-specific DNA methylase